MNTVLFIIIKGVIDGIKADEDPAVGGHFLCLQRNGQEEQHRRSIPLLRVLRAARRGLLLAGLQGALEGHWAVAGSEEDGEGEEPEGGEAPVQLVLDPATAGSVGLMQDHPNIVKMYEMFEDGSHYYMVTEYL